MSELSIAGKTAASPSLPSPIRSTIQRSASSSARCRNGRHERRFERISATRSARRKKFRQVKEALVTRQGEILLLGADRIKFVQLLVVVAIHGSA